MKRILLLLTAIAFFSNLSFAQWTTSGNNIYYPTGNVAVGSSGTWPYYKFSVSTGSYEELLVVDDNAVAFGDFAGDVNNTFLQVDDNNSIVFIQANNGIKCSVPYLQCAGLSVGSASGSGLNYGTSYLGFNTLRSGTNWTMYSDGYHNGAGMVYGDIYGNIFFSTIVSTGTSDQSLSDGAITNKIALKIGNDGITYAKQVVVKTSIFPDYVFYPTYKLTPLSEVKTYIEQNHHLPEMPTAAEVEKDGLNLGEMNKLLTKKVEELTLYLIVKDKELSEQKQTINVQEERLKTIEKRLEITSPNH